MDNQNQNNNTLRNPHASISNTLAIYTVLKTLRKMKQELGLEAMLEYCESYTGNLEAHNPHLKCAVAVALEFMDVKKLYREVCER